ncbi:MAG: AzlC family ABC transporter permease [Microthrixaceae bacterium]
MTDGATPGTSLRAHARAGVLDILPMLVGVVPFGLVAGAAPAAAGFGVLGAVGFSTIVFAGASQLAATGVLADGGSAVVAVLAACTINLRMVLYSASLAPYLSATRRRTRLGVAYLLTDQAYAVSIRRWAGERAVHDPPGRPRERVAFYLGAGLTLWVTWQVSTVVGALVGRAVPDDVPLTFAVPLVFLVLLVPTLTNRPAWVAAGAGGVAAVLAAGLGAGPLSVMVGAVVGIAAGFVVDRDEGVEG